MEMPMVRRRMDKQLIVAQEDDFPENWSVGGGQATCSTACRLRIKSTQNMATWAEKKLARHWFTM
jgi:hypothetical protein